MTQDDGGPAFPCDRIPMTEGVICSDGITMRDYFAAKALAGMLAYFNEHRGDFHTNSTAKETAEYAYQMADAMIEARKQPVSK